MKERFCKREMQMSSLVRPLCSVLLHTNNASAPLHLYLLCPGWRSQLWGGGGGGSLMSSKPVGRGGLTVRKRG
jgi:hypothetical protein